MCARLLHGVDLEMEVDMGVIRGLGKAVGGLLMGVGGLVSGVFSGVGKFVRRLF